MKDSQHLVVIITRNSPSSLLKALKYEGYNTVPDLVTIEYKTSKNVRNNMPVYTAVIRLK